MKKIIMSVLCALILLGGMVPVSVHANEEEEQLYGYYYGKLQLIRLWYYGTNPANEIEAILRESDRSKNQTETVQKKTKAKELELQKSVRNGNEEEIIKALMEANEAMNQLSAVAKDIK